MFSEQKINELIQGIEWGLGNIEKFTYELKQVKEALLELKNNKNNENAWQIQELKSELATIRKELIKRGLPEASKYEAEYQQLKELLLSDEWPVAVDPSVICTNVELEQIRAHAILDQIVIQSVTNRKFLDFGCSKDTIVSTAINRDAKFAIGYDPNPKENSKHITTKFEDVQKNGPYDIILLYDVLDHVDEHPKNVLYKLKTVCTNATQIYVCVHPWTAKHGGHLYTNLNKAYAHLVFDEIELLRMGGYQPDYLTLKSFNPFTQYKNWFQEAGFDVKEESYIKKEVHELFLSPNLVNQRLQKYWTNSVQMRECLEIEFIEYKLEAQFSLDQQII